jgi:hypothetical protein
LGLDWYQFKWRMHDPALGRFMVVDPLAEDYYYNSPYAFSENKVTSHYELEGLEALSVHVYELKKNNDGAYTAAYKRTHYIENGGDHQGLKNQYQLLVTNGKGNAEKMYYGDEAIKNANNDGVTISKWINKEVDLVEAYKAVSNSYRGEKAINTAKGVIAVASSGLTLTGGSIGVLGYYTLASNSDELLGGDEGALTNLLIENNKLELSINGTKTTVDMIDLISSFEKYKVNGGKRALLMILFNSLSLISDANSTQENINNESDERENQID